MNKSGTRNGAGPLDPQVVAFAESTVTLRTAEERRAVRQALLALNGSARCDSVCLANNGTCPYGQEAIDRVPEPEAVLFLTQSSARVGYRVKDKKRQYKAPSDTDWGTLKFWSAEAILALADFIRSQEGK